MTQKSHLSPMVAAAGLLGALACRQHAPAPATTALDLVPLFEQAHIYQPLQTIDFGTPEARPFLLSGWSIEVREFDERRALWSLGETAAIEFFVSQPQTLQVRLVAAYVGPPSREGPVVQLRVNEKDWTRLRLKPSLEEYTAHLPAPLLVQGINRLTVVHPPVEEKRPPRVDRRALWDSLSFGAPSSPRPAPYARTDNNVIALPFETRLDYYLNLPPEARLEVDKVLSRGSPTGRLRVLWQPENGLERVMSEDLSAEASFGVSLTGSEAEVGRLALHAISDKPPETPATSGMVLFEPRVLIGSSPAPEPRSEPARTATSRPDLKPNVIVYLIDTLRADHLGCYGYNRNVSPHIDAFAETSTLFVNAQAQSPWTRASVASMLTGLLPQVHGANGDDDALSDSIVTLAELLAAAGYETAGYTANGNAARVAGIAQGFETFKYLRQLVEERTYARSSEVHEAVVSYLNHRKGGRPLFLWVHTIDPHAPYAPPEPFRTTFAESVAGQEVGSIDRIVALTTSGKAPSEAQIRDLTDLYDAEIAANDASFGALLQELRARGIYENSLIVVLSDHGEEFYDHGGWTHGKTLFAEMLDTPLIVKLPQQERGHRVEQIVDHVDLFPTVLDLVGVEVPGDIQGLSFLPFLSGDEALSTWDNRSIAHLDLRGRLGTSYLESSWKLILYSQGGAESFPELYDHRSDPHERTNLATERTTMARYLSTLLHNEESSLTGMKSAKANPEELKAMEEELKALGYLGEDR